MTKTVALLGLFCIAVFADIEPLGTRPSKFNAKIQIWKALRVGDTDLQLQAEALRHMTLIKDAAYVASFYGVDRLPFTGDVAEAFSNQKQQAVRLTFLRPLEAKSLRVFFLDALLKNNVEVNEPSVALALDALSFDMKKGESLMLVGGSTATKNVQSLTISGPSGEKQVQGPKVATHFWKSWLGNSADHGLADLKAQVVHQLKNR